MKTRSIDQSELVKAVGLQPDEDYGEADICHTDITMHTHKGYAFEVYYDQFAGPMSQWKAFCMGIGTKAQLERDDVIAEMRGAIDRKEFFPNR
jgi:hypothetical protein